MNMPERLNKDFYLNLRAQLWWEMRIRFERAYQHVNDIKKWSLDDMISIPNRAELISELSQPLVEYTDSGKVKIESKKAMKRRGIPSPNEAEALLLAFVPKRQVVAARPTRVADAAGWT
jgi:phage terminase large subunit